MIQWFADTRERWYLMSLLEREAWRELTKEEQAQEGNGLEMALRMRLLGESFVTGVGA